MIKPKKFINNNKKEIEGVTNQPIAFWIYLFFSEEEKKEAKEQ
jgi:hypothetical protein